MKLSNKYIAGLIDGDGCIQISMTKGVSWSKRKYYQLRISIGNMNYPVLKRIRKQFGGSVHLVMPKRRFYTWYIVSKSAYEFLKKIYPYLQIKKEEAEIAINFQEGVGKGWIKIKNDEDREKARKELSRLKKRKW